jgi:hypothetical protein
MNAFVVAVVGTVTLAGLVRVQAQRAPEAVDFRPVADGKNWIVKEPLIYEVGISIDRVTVPRGFVTDFATIPPVLQSLIQQNGPHLLPAVVHDYLYWKQTCTREEADQLFLLAMIENKVPVADRTAMHQAVRAAGSFAWTGNARDRTAGRLRILPEDRIKVPSLTTWPDYQRRLAMEGVKDGPDTPVARGFCARGSMPTEQALTTR